MAITLITLVLAAALLARSEYVYVINYKGLE